jgi:hypothetical protein
MTVTNCIVGTMLLEKLTFIPASQFLKNVWRGKIMEEFMLKLDTVLLGLVALGGIALKVIDEIKVSSRTKKVDVRNKEILDQIAKNRLNSLQALIYSNVPLLMRMEAFLEYIKLGGNHSTVKFALVEIIVPNKDLWWSVVEKYRHEEPYNPVIFSESMKKIKDALH